MNRLRNILPRTLILATAFCATLSSAAAVANPVLMPAPPKLAATSYVLMDAATGTIIVSHDEHKRLPPASLTKMMTSYIASSEINKGNIEEEDTATVSEKAWRKGGSKMFIEVGKEVKIGDLLKGIIIVSGNDASIAMAEHIAGGEDAFADLMNQHAKLLGMNDTHFVNASGWPADGHESSAHDLALLARAIINDFPEHYKLYSEKQYRYGGLAPQPNRNTLLFRDDSVDGLKTGHTEEAGYCLVSSAKRDGMRLIAVVMGTKSTSARAEESQKLLNYGFRFYETVSLYDSQEVLNESKVWSGKTDTLELGTSEPIAVTVPRGQRDALAVNLELDKVIRAPVTEGSVYGKLTVSLNGQTLKESSVIAYETVEPGGLFTRIWHSIVLFVMSLIG